MTSTSTNPHLRILHLEDDDNDADLVSRALLVDGLECELSRAVTRDDFLVAIEKNPDVVLADYRIPGYSGIEALADFRARDQDAPFLFVSGTIGDEAAVATLKSGATDYVVKDRLIRLGAAIRRALAERAERDARKQAEALAREQGALLDKAREAIIAYDMARHITYWNRGAELLYGVAAKDALGRDPQDLLHFGSPRELAEARTAVATDGTWAGVLHQRTKLQKEVTVQSYWTLLRDDAGTARSILVVGTDITEMHRLEAKFLRVQRLESLGFLVSGIAHDLNNVLSPMVVALQVLRDKVSDERGRRMVDVLDASAARAASLVRQVLTFARGADSERMLVQPTHVLREIEKMLRESLPKSIDISAEIGQSVWNIRADPTQLHQVLLNLCVNARDAISGQGKLYIHVANVMLDASYVAMRPESRSGPYVLFTVSDTGVGIAPEHLDRIFDPFFSTKDTGKGTGLGLSTVAAIVRSHEGFLEVESTPGLGSSFKVYFPARPTSPVLSAAPLIPPLLGHGETILFVDDEEPVREILREALEHAGFAVITASDGAEAVALYARHPDHPAVVVLDMHMPVMDGVTTLHALSRIDPRVRVVATSGLGENEMLAKQAGAQAFIPKPFTIHSLLLALQQVMGPAAHN